MNKNRRLERLTNNSLCAKKIRHKKLAMKNIWYKTIDQQTSSSIRFNELFGKDSIPDTYDMNYVYKFCKNKDRLDNKGLTKVINKRKKLVI